MAYKFKPRMIYRMPTHFGPTLGLRQGPDGKTFAPDTRDFIAYSVSYLSNREQLEELLPEGFEVGAEPVVTVEGKYLKNIKWLAGRGYNILGVSFPAVFKGKTDKAMGSFLAVLWENMFDPIMCGREEIGWSKIWGELPEPRVCNEVAHCTASWMGFRFLDMRVKNLKQLNNEEIQELKKKNKSDGILHYKYIPKTGEWGVADAAYTTLSSNSPLNTTEEIWKGEGTVTFHEATWEDLPTQFTIVNALRALEIKEYRGATMVVGTEGDDLRGQRILL